MKITDLLKKQSIQLQASPNTKEEAIRQLADLMEAGGNVTHKEQYIKDVLAREESGSTGLGMGLATPHAKSTGIATPGLAAMTVPSGMDFESLDGEPSRLFFMIAAPEEAADTHVQVLANLATLIMDADFKEALIKAQTTAGFLALIDIKEADQFKPNMTETDALAMVEQNIPPSSLNDINTTSTTDTMSTHYKVLAVTACPTGIAHTAMAAESLHRTAAAMGISIKVEQNGASGVKNALTVEEISKADCIIIAADKSVPMARFNGKPLIQVKVADGINKAEELLTEATTGTPATYQANDEDITNHIVTANDSLGRQIYKHLMNGVSHMLPFVIGGGILIALAFLFDDFNPAAPSKFGSGTELAAFFMKIGSASFSFMLPVLAGFIGMSIADRPGLAVGFVGGYIANAGGSGFLGALLAGFVAGYLMLLLKKLFSRLPHTLEGIKLVLLYPVLGVLLIGIVITFLINPPVGALNEGLMNSLQSMTTSSRIVMGLIFAGMMAVDMGGPVNKAAYVIGTGFLATGEYGVMAAVMAGGMVPPLAIALCTTFFPNRFTPAERKSGVTNYIMGLSFITEGAIPFAAADPIRLIPACVIGAAIAGALSMAFECTLRAPHGGIFVVPTIGNPLMYLGAILIGSVVTALLLAILKKPLATKNNA